MPGSSVDSGVPEDVFEVDESQDGPLTSSSVNGSAPGTWQRKACKDMVPRKLENKSLASGRMMSNLGINYIIGPDKVPTVFANERNFWNGTPQVISYFFMGGSKLQHEKVAQAIDEWTWYANIVFVMVPSAEESNVRITFDPDDGSWSYIGRQSDIIPAREATMNLAWLDKFSPITAKERAVILHEFGHALGLIHEHQAPSRRNEAVQNIGAVLEFYEKTPGWTKQQIFERVINVYNKSDISNYSQVDVHSIMHYPQPKELTGLDEDIPYNTKLSDLDKAYMILQYPRKTMYPRAAKDGWGIEKALKVIAAPADVTHKVLNLVKEDVDEFGEISPVNIREVIKNWTRATHGFVKDGGHNSAPLRGNRPATTGPSHAENLDAPPSNSFIYQLYEKMSSPVGEEYPALRSPTQLPDKDILAYESDRNLSRVNKPVVANEFGFNPTEASNPISLIVGGPNGQNLSQNYEKALNGLIPTFESKEVLKQRERMRRWLLTETKAGDAAYTDDTRLVIPGLSTESAKKLSETYGMNITAGDPRTEPMADQAEAMLMAKQAIEAVRNSKQDSPRGMSRLELSEFLMQEYLRDRQAWEEQKDKMISEASGLPVTDPQARRDLTRRLADDAALEIAKASAKHRDAMARRYGHTVDGMPGSMPRPAAPKPGDIVEALRVSLQRGDFADWARQQPENVKDEILAALMKAFGKATDRKEG